jgi:hypothetical protein
MSELTKKQAKERCKEKLKEKLDKVELSDDEISLETLEWNDEDWAVTAFTGFEPSNPMLGEFLESEDKLRLIRSLPPHKTISYRVMFKQDQGFTFRVFYNYVRENAEFGYSESMESDIGD